MRDRWAGGNPTKVPAGCGDLRCGGTYHGLAGFLAAKPRTRDLRNCRISQLLERIVGEVVVRIGPVQSAPDMTGDQVKAHATTAYSM